MSLSKLAYLDCTGVVETGQRKLLGWLTLQVMLDNNSTERGSVCRDYKIIVEPASKNVTNWNCNIEFRIHHGTNDCNLDKTEKKWTTWFSPLSVSYRQIPVCRCGKSLGISYLIQKADDGFDTEFGTLEGNLKFLNPQLAERFEANCKILVGDDERAIFVNRQWLSFNCKFFKVMFASDFAEKDAPEIRLPKVSCEDFLTFLRCIYPPTDPITEHNVCAVFKLADQFECDTLLGASENFLNTSSPQLNMRDGSMCVEIAERRRFQRLVKKLIEGAATVGIFDQIFLQPEWFNMRNEDTRNLILKEASRRLREQAARMRRLKEEVAKLQKPSNCKC